MVDRQWVAWIAEKRWFAIDALQYKTTSSEIGRIHHLMLERHGLGGDERCRGKGVVQS